MVSDIYSTDNYLNINTESFTIQTNFQSLNFQERVSGTNSIDVNALFIDEVLGNCCNDIVIANSRLNRDVLIVDGLATTTVLYRNNETNSVVPYTMQVPFSIDLKIGNVKDNSQVCVNAKLTKASVKARRGVELEFGGELNISVSISELNEEAVIDSVEISDEKNDRDCNLVIYVAKEGDTVWDIAKEMSVSEEVILEQNPDLVLPIVAGSRIVVYRQTYASIN